MDLTRVFGTAAGGYADPTTSAPTGSAGYDSLSAFRNPSGGSAAGGGAGGSPPGQPSMNPQQAFRGAHDASVALQREAQGYDQTVSALHQQVQALQRAVDAAKSHYQAVTREKDQFHQLLAAAEGRLGEVQRVVQRYTIVQEPVVASDGYTYERRVIKQYLDECQRSGVAPISQQTQAELTSTLIPNQSLKKLVELLKAAKPASTPETGGGASGSSGFKQLEGIPRAKEASGGGAQGDGRLHPCVRVYGYCNYKESCTYAQYPYDACLSHLKGKCRFGSQCHEMHVDFKGPTGTPQANGGARDFRGQRRDM